MAEDQRFINEIERTETRVQSYLSRLRLGLYLYLDDFLDETREAEDDEFYAILSSVLAPSSFVFTRGLATIYQRELRELRPRFGVNPEDAKVTRDIAKIHQAKINNDIKNILTTVTSTSSMARAAGQTPTRASIRADLVEPKLNSIETELNTNISGYRSSMEIKKAKEIETDPRFAYIGPRDNKNRPLCRYILDKGQLWSEKEIRELDGHPDANLIPVKVYGGGYNCRHRWIYTKRK